MQSSSGKIGSFALFWVLASGLSWAAPAASLSGIVRDTRGIAQVGVVVQVLASDSVSVATAVTDLYGRYRIANLIPGRYRVLASAPLFVPARRDNLRLLTGARATVNLTLTMLSDPAAWLPAERRRPDQRDDDWTWTLRSAANRPMLRILDDGQVVQIAPDTVEAGGPHAGASTHGRISVFGGDGGFANGGLRGVATVDRAGGNDGEMVLRTELASSAVSMGSGPSAQLPAAQSAASTEIDAGYERHTGLNAASRVVVSYESHPEMAGADGASGLQLIRLASAERMKLGDSLDLEAGATVYAVHMAGDTVVSQPFLRVTIHPGKVWAVRYRLATGADLQEYSGLDSLQAAIPVTAPINGILRTAGGVHHELSASRAVGRGLVEAAVYHDAITHSTISGTGLPAAADLAGASGSSGLVADTVTRSFRFLGMGYNTGGLSVTVSEPLSSEIWATLAYRKGSALSARGGPAVPLSELSSGMRPEAAQSATAALQARLRRQGASMEVAYRWQPERLLTGVDSYGAPGEPAFLSFCVRQTVRWRDRLPPGLEARIDVTNLLEQGYRPFLSADGRTLFLAQSPRTLQAGLAFSF